jgi:hypothetical protein
MLYAILAYHEEHIVTSWSEEEDAALMADLQKAHGRVREKGTLGPAARLGATKTAVTLRGPGEGVVLDGPFAETKEQLLGLYLYDCPDQATAIAAARELHRANPTAVYEIRPIRLFQPGAVLEKSEAEV